MTPIPDCPIHHPRINECAELVLRHLVKLGIQPYEEGTGEGLLRYLQLTATSELPGGRLGTAQSPEALVQLVLVWNAPRTGAGAPLRALVESLWREGGGSLLHSIHANYQPARTNTIFGPDWEVLRGPELALQSLRPGIPPASFAAGSFMQANLQSFQSALLQLEGHIPRGSRVCDLHSGVGAIGLTLLAR